jgi:CRISPR-associated endonuclease/helicase Cas3
VEQGYRVDDTPWEDDEHPPTRLGEPTVTLRLVRSKEGRLTPWHGEGRHAWERASLQVRRSLVAAEAPDLPEPVRRALDALKNTMPARGRNWVALVMSESVEGARAGAADLAGTAIDIAYSARSGLTVRPQC